MTRELLLLRHGKSDWTTNAEDFDRPLKDRGKRSAQRVGVWLAQQGVFPDLVVSSPAERALATAHKTIKAMGHGTDHVLKDDRIYEAGLAKLLKVLADCPLASRVMMVGHNPGFEYLLLHLTDGKVEPFEDGKLMPTGALARLTLPDDWSDLPAGCAELLTLIRSDTLPDRFPFPGPGGGEMRKRPAYYYRQSSVIPYRVTKTGPEILVVLSSNKKHFVVPKGIHEPGLTARESAAKEALEEAGVEGTVGKKSLGTYEYQKWGAPCTVKVYAMEVERMVPESEWEEHHRGRQWVKPKDAVKKLKEPALAPLVKKLVEQLKAAV